MIRRIDARGSKFEYRTYHFIYRDQAVGEFVLYKFPDKTAKVYNVIIYEEFRGKGLALKLMQDVIHLAKLRRIRSLRLTVRVTNTPALRTYLRVGFVIVGSDNKREQFGMEKSLV